jgi:hypothetical protein
VAKLFVWNFSEIEQRQRRAYQRQGIDLLPRPALDLLAKVINIPA